LVAVSSLNAWRSQTTFFLRSSDLYLELAHYLGSDRSFYGLQPLGLDGKQPPLKQIEAMAAYYIQAIQTVQPHGSYYLGGWSFGGLVAFDMAQQLTQAGQEVALLAIFDAPAPITANQPSPGHSLKVLLKTVLWSTLPFLLDYTAIVLNSQRLKAPQHANSKRQQQN
jgi:pimeloyl-ACP methyl ester carboxylesterase